MLRIFIRALMGFYRHRAREDGVRDGQSGSVTFVQRVGSAANLNVRYHVIALDGVFAEDVRSGRLHFHSARTPTDDGIAGLLAQRLDCSRLRDSD